jgi:hypothetical protein
MTGNNKNALETLSKNKKYTGYSLFLDKHKTSFLGRLMRDGITIGKIHAYCFKDKKTILEKIDAIIAKKYPDERLRKNTSGK